MDKIENIKKYQDLYKKYKELVAKTTIRVYKVTNGEKINALNITSEDLIKRKETEGELKNGLIFLTDNQLIDLAGDVGLASEALNTLAKRKETL